MEKVELEHFGNFLEVLRPDLVCTVHGDLLSLYGKSQGFLNVRRRNGQFIFQSSKEESWSTVSGDPYSKVLWNSTLAYVFGPNRDGSKNFSPPRVEPAKPTETQDMQKSKNDDLLRGMFESETLGAYTDLGVIIQGLTLSPYHCPDTGIRIYTYSLRQLRLECRIRAREVVMSVMDLGKHDELPHWKVTLTNANDAQYHNLKRLAEIAVRHLHERNEEATAPRAEPVKTSQPQEMQSVSVLREKEKTLLQEHRERQKQLKKVAKAFAVVITETVRTHLLDTERIKTGASVGRMYCSLTTPDADDVWRLLPDHFVDSGFSVRKDTSDKKKLNVMVDV